MKEIKNHKIPGWVLGLIAIGCLVASGIYLGILSVNGISTNHIIKAIGYGSVGLLFFYGVYHK